MNSMTSFVAALGDGLELTLSPDPPTTGLFQILLLVRGSARWQSHDQTQTMEAHSVWWLGPTSADDWIAADPPGQAMWFRLAGSQCPVPELDPLVREFTGPSGPRALPSLFSEIKELMEIATTCRYPCDLRNLLARGKGLMVVSKALHSLKTEPPPSSYDVRFFQDDLNKVRQARELILQRMTGPPTLTQLAREVGLNELKLKAGFQKLWGTTVFGLLRRERLLLARQLLESGECNVSGAAFRVGYTNTSHFARSFLAQFGVSPGVIARSSGD